ncbi:MULTISPECIES: hypothetical protein [Kordiimonas]|jgi:hypothetical protein|uniref:Sporulation related domain-containing protein n=1 Tax=Kordiimonas lacus TaxID=637679 RepID=A0A1G7E7P1_9PROT|nr:MULTISPECIES: hypothetical protein [Kordiimonas]SDE59500.1 hypothetical protein SAMN04488071_3315 [Kordiimonas lacus]
MRKLSKSGMSITAKGAGFALSLLLVAACSSGPSGPKPTAGAKRAPNQVANALCEGRAADAVTMLTAEPLSGPVDRFFTALAMEKSGHPVSARKIYASLMTSGATDPVYLDCGSEVFANGTVSGEAARRLAVIAQDLRSLDVAATRPQTLHEGLPTLDGSSISAVRPSSGFSSTPMTVYRPASTSPLGRWFAHLESYKTYQSAQANKPTLEAKFTSLKGYIDQWEVNVSGGVVRLGVRLDEREDARRLCQQVKSNGDYCAVLDTAP